jgi:hypothetical protein
MHGNATKNIEEIASWKEKKGNTKQENSKGQEGLFVKGAKTIKFMNNGAPKGAEKWVRMFTMGYQQCTSKGGKLP